MNNELIELISDHLLGKQNSQKISRETISSAESHSLLPILYYQTKDKSLRIPYLQAINAYTQRSKLLEQIFEAFSDIPFYSVKGLLISHYYPVPQLRTMSDCDIVVHKEDKERAKQILLSIGFQYVETKWDSAEWHFAKQGLDFELHHCLSYDEVVNTKEEKAFTDTAWCYVNNHELDENFHFVFLLIHLKKHLLNYGVGFRQFMDLAAMSKNAKLDPNTIYCFLKSVGLERFAGVCSALCLRWFGIALSVDTPEISDEFYQTATETILANGVFGFDNSENIGKKVLIVFRKLPVAMKPWKTEISS